MIIDKYDDDDDDIIIIIIIIISSSSSSSSSNKTIFLNAQQIFPFRKESAVNLRLRYSYMQLHHHPLPLVT